VTADCVFCDIMVGRTTASRVCEDPQAMAFLDLYPIHPGHTLVVPREHVTDLAACPFDLAGHLFSVSGHLGPVLARAVDAAGFNVWTANGSAAGQDIFHLHLHILPRFRDDSFGLRFPKSYPQATSRKALDDMASRIRSLL
jgi:histidine triad (HIT) family protein